jgi:predicted molibdopterin-dependent oxidoreductase YjgC
MSAPRPPSSETTPAASRRIAGVEAARTVRFTFDGETIEALEGETIAVALYAAGKSTLRTTQRKSEPRGLFCNMGVCFECLVEVDRHANLRACQTVVQAGMQVKTQRGFGYTDVAPEFGE